MTSRPLTPPCVPFGTRRFLSFHILAHNSAPMPGALENSQPCYSKQGWLLFLQKFFNRRQHGGRAGNRFVALHYIAFVVDEELGEIPLNALIFQILGVILLQGIHKDSRKLNTPRPAGGTASASWLCWYLPPDSHEELWSCRQRNSPPRHRSRLSAG